MTLHAVTVTAVAYAFVPMRQVIHKVARWSVLALAGLLVQDKFHGLDIDGGWLWLVVSLLGAGCVLFIATWPTFLNWLADAFPYRVVRVGAVQTEVRSLEPAIGVYIPDPSCSRYAYADTGTDCFFCHLEVWSLRDEPLRRCHAKLMRLAAAQGNDYVDHPALTGALRLKWSHAERGDPEFEFRDIAPDFPQRLDVLFMLEQQPGVAYIENAHEGSVGLPTWIGPGNYRITVRVEAEDCPVTDFTFLVMFVGKWPHPPVFTPYNGPPLSLRRPPTPDGLNP